MTSTVGPFSTSVTGTVYTDGSRRLAFSMDLTRWATFLFFDMLPWGWNEYWAAAASWAQQRILPAKASSSGAFRSSTSKLQQSNRPLHVIDVDKQMVVHSACPHCLADSSSCHPQMDCSISLTLDGYGHSYPGSTTRFSGSRLTRQDDEYSFHSLDLPAQLNVCADAMATEYSDNAHQHSSETPSSQPASFRQPRSVFWSICNVWHPNIPNRLDFTYTEPNIELISKKLGKPGNLILSGTTSTCKVLAYPSRALTIYPNTSQARCCTGGSTQDINAPK